MSNLIVKLIGVSVKIHKGRSSSKKKVRLIRGAQ